MELGILTEPPISVPQPTREPCKARRAASPPVDPPGVKSGLRGFVVSPQRGFSVSHHFKMLTNCFECVVCIVYHDALRKIRLRNDYRSQVLQYLDHGGIICRWFPGHPNISQSCIHPFDIKLIFDCDWNSMKWPDGFPINFVVFVKTSSFSDRFLENNFS